MFTPVIVRKDKTMSKRYWNNCNFNELEGKIITKIEGLHDGSDCVTFHALDGWTYRMEHWQD
jgi:hypothetical protein